MTVKSIFKILLMTIVVIVGGSVLFEFYNVNTVSMTINQLAHTSANQSAILFSQESYKSAAENNQSNTQMHVLSSNNEIYVSGKFYNGNTAAQIYNSLYTSTTFKNWLKSDEIQQKGNWYNLGLIDKALNTPGFLSKEYGQTGYEEARTAQMFKDSMMTPSNLGIPYLDKDVLTKMFRWNLAALFSNGKADNIKKDHAGFNYVSYNGFRIYADMATISELEYKVLNLETPSGRTEFEKITNIKPSKLGLSGDERSRIALVGIKYKIPIAYEGVTPIKEVFRFVWDTEVQGIDGKSQRDASVQEWKEDLAEYESGGLSGNVRADGVLPVPGKLIYYIIR